MPHLWLRLRGNKVAKAYSKAAKLKAKKAKGFDKKHGLAPIPQQKARGRARMAEIENEIPVYQARARQMGISIDEAKHEMLSEDAGRAIYTISDKEQRERLWGHYKALTAALWRYQLLCLDISPHAKSAKLEMMPERFEARADDKPDLRTPEEKADAARRAWKHWERTLEGAEGVCRWSIMQAINDPMLTPVQKRMFLDAMRALDAAVEK